MQCHFHKARWCVTWNILVYIYILNLMWNTYRFAIGWCVDQSKLIGESDYGQLACAVDVTLFYDMVFIHS